MCSIDSAVKSRSYFRLVSFCQLRGIATMTTNLIYKQSVEHKPQKMRLRVVKWNSEIIITLPEYLPKSLEKPHLLLSHQKSCANMNELFVVSAGFNPPLPQIS